MSQKKFKDTILCTLCKGEDNDCPLCEGTGVMLYDEKNSDAKEIFFSDIGYENENLLEDDDREES